MKIVWKILIAVLVLTLFQPSELLAKKKDGKPASSSRGKPKKPVNPFKGLAPIQSKPSEDIIGTGTEGAGGLNPFEESQVNAPQGAQADVLTDDGSDDNTVGTGGKSGTVVPALPEGFKLDSPADKKTNKKARAEAERLAGRKLEVARRLLETNPDSALERLQGIITDYPKSKAAQQAKDILAQRKTPGAK